MESVEIKPSHKGLLHKSLGIPEGDKIPMKTLKKHQNTSDPKLKKRIIFAENFGK